MIELRCTALTPMFCYGTDQNSPEIRAASIKGMLRYWWRVFNPNKTKANLLQAESELFGDTNSKSPFDIIIQEDAINKINSALPADECYIVEGAHNAEINVLDYLAYGRYDFGTHTFSSYIPPGSRFTIKLWNQKLKEADLRLLINYLKIGGLLGGIGSKSRNGYGHFLIHDNLVTENEILDLRTENDISDYLAVSEKVRIFQTNNTFDNWNKALGIIGKSYYKVRTDGIFESQHHYEKRAYVGFPVNTLNQEDKEKVKQIGRVRRLKRHAKSLYMSIVPDNNTLRGYLIYFPHNYFYKPHEYLSEMNRFCDLLALCPDLMEV